MEDWKNRLKVETQENIDRLNKLQDFFRTPNLYNLSRDEKDLLYEQLHIMIDYVYILGKRCELYGIELDI